MNSRAILASVGLLLISAIGTSQPAAAQAKESQPDRFVSTSQLMFDGFDIPRALDNGYEIRTDTAGWQYAVPVGTPKGSLVGASFKFNPTTKQVKPTSIVTQGTVSGNCGSATLTLYTKTSGYTSYSLNGLYGGSVYHQWSISLSAQTGNTIVNRDGFPPFPGALNWGTNFSYNVGAAATNASVSGVASGIVTTTLGTCSGLLPRDTI